MPQFSPLDTAKLERHCFRRFLINIVLQSTECWLGQEKDIPPRPSRWHTGPGVQLSSASLPGRPPLASPLSWPASPSCWRWLGSHLARRRVRASVRPCGHGSEVPADKCHTPLPPTPAVPKRHCPLSQAVPHLQGGSCPWGQVHQDKGRSFTPKYPHSPPMSPLTMSPVVLTHRASLFLGIQSDD